MVAYGKWRHVLARKGYELDNGMDGGDLNALTGGSLAGSNGENLNMEGGSLDAWSSVQSGDGIFSSLMSHGKNLFRAVAPHLIHGAKSVARSLLEGKSAGDAFETGAKAGLANAMAGGDLEEQAGGRLSKRRENLNRLMGR